MAQALAVMLLASKELSAGCSAHFPLVELTATKGVGHLPAVAMAIRNLDFAGWARTGVARAAILLLLLLLLALSVRETKTIQNSQRAWMQAGCPNTNSRANVPTASEREKGRGNVKDETV